VAEVESGFRDPKAGASVETGGKTGVGSSLELCPFLDDILSDNS
jgi:hypothetical protein